jgi:4-hydroxy-tetrahydrodipicolinate synthase
MALRGTLPVVPTPFVDGEIDFESLGRMIAFLVPALDGYTLSGSTGEAPSLTLQERMAIAEYALRHTPADKTVVIGITHTDVRAAIELAQHAAAQGAKGCLVPSPYYFANTPRGVYEYLKLIDQHVDIDLVFYDNPFSTKTSWSASQLAELAAGLPHLTSIKMTDLAIQKIAWLKQHSNLTVFAGEDQVLYRSLLLGADGCMVIAPALFPQAYQEAWHLLQAEKLRESYALYSRSVLPVIHMFGMGREIAATKAIYKHMGIFTSAEVRPPLEPCDPVWEGQLILAYETAQAI